MTLAEKDRYVAGTLSKEDEADVRFRLRQDPLSYKRVEDERRRRHPRMMQNPDRIPRTLPTARGSRFPRRTSSAQKPARFRAAPAGPAPSGLLWGFFRDSPISISVIRVESAV